MDSFDKNHPPKKRDQKFPSLERLHVLFEYDPETGVLHHKLCGEPVGTDDSQGTLCVSIDGDAYYVHHIVWHMLSNGGAGSGQVDVGAPSSTFVRRS
jgi:hypothetical protein